MGYIVWFHLYFVYGGIHRGRPVPENKIRFPFEGVRGLED